jgi:hypothetical protein
VEVFNRRNAAVGWLTLTIGKRVLRRKAKGAVPRIDPETKRPNRSAVALMTAGAAGVATGVTTFWRRRLRSGSGDKKS